MADAEDIPLAEAIRRLREELIAAAAEGAGEDVRFRLGPVELDLEVAATREGGGEAGIRFWPAAIGGRAQTSRARTHRINPSLQPVGADGKDLPVGGQAAQRPR
ncbi:MAG TPA: trypco2 family protein [Miltoncostaeaceae bacterium]|nr:trypco2 family protein [Miltoncostaeaceae bacterium]